MAMTAVLASSALAWSPSTLLAHRQRRPDAALGWHADAVMKIGTVPSSELKKRYDLVVVGGGPAGVAGALKGAYMGKRVLLIDKPKAAPPGGGLDFFFGGPTGLFSKALRDCAKAYDVGGLESMKLDRDVIFKQVQNSCMRLARNNAETQIMMLNKFKVGYMQGEATLDLNHFNGRLSDDSAKLRVRPSSSPQDTVEVQAGKVLLCTGSYAAHPPGIPFDGERVLDSDTVNGIDFLPRSVVVAGSGLIAIEMANIFRNLGAEVTMVVRGSAMSALERIGLDYTIAERLLSGLRRQHVTVLEETEIDSFEFSDCPVGVDDRDIGGEECTPLRLTIKTADSKGELVDAGAIEADLYLACLGRRPRARATSLALEENGIKLHEGTGHILVDDGFETSQKGIYAAGDCVAGPALASTGVDQAQRAVNSMFGCQGDSCTTEETPFPIGVWTIPEVGYYGLTLQAAVEAGYDADEGVASYDACLRGRVFSPDGMLKLVYDRQTTRVLGVHIIGTDACELVHYGMDLVAKQATLFDVIGTLFTAVTFHELFKEAALNANEKLDFGIEWQELLYELKSSLNLSIDEQPDEELLRKRFHEIDVSGDGSLDEEELMEVFNKLGSPVSPQLVANVIRLVDDDGNGSIELEEFLQIFQVLGDREKMAQKMAEQKMAKVNMSQQVEFDPPELVTS